MLPYNTGGHDRNRANVAGRGRDGCREGERLDALWAGRASRERWPARRSVSKSPVA